MSRETRILIVDDEIAFCPCISKYFLRKGFDAYYATDGEEGLRLLVEKKPDLMTLYMCMPSKSKIPMLNGIDTLKKARRIYDDMSIVMVSASELINEEEPFEDMGATKVINKPVDLERLFGLIESLIEKH